MKFHLGVVVGTGMLAIGLFPLVTFAEWPLHVADSTDTTATTSAPEAGASPTPTPIERLDALGLPGVDAAAGVVPAKRYVLYKAPNGLVYITDTVSGTTVSTSDAEVIGLIDPIGITGTGVDQ